jgi:hypothetical protein
MGMESDWYRRKAAELGASARSATTQKQRKDLERDQQNWLRIADNIDEREAVAKAKQRPSG